MDLLSQACAVGRFRCKSFVMEMLANIAERGRISKEGKKNTDTEIRQVQPHEKQICFGRP